MSVGICRALLFLCVMFATCLAYTRTEIEDRMQFSPFHEHGKGAVSAAAADNQYLRYLSEYFGRPMQRRFADGPSY